jgi:glycosyltransferase involved in cell wall biosynthesis
VCLLKTTVVICSVNRPDVLSETIESVLQGQSTPPREIIVSVCNREHVPERILAEASVRVVVSARQGLTVQRNTGAKLVRTPYTLFLDDDVEIAPNFIESMERLLDEVQDAVAATGFLVADGVRWDTGLNRKSARTAAVGYVQGRDNYDRDELYGCNLFVRTDIFKKVLFDERLALYGWLEDLDFTTNCLRFGRTIVNAETCVAHLATPGGRISGPKLGYSQIVNPFYLWRKNGKPGLSHVVVAHWFVFVARNIFRALAKIPSGRGDRKGRFRGNVIGMWHLMKGKVDPSYILQLEDTAGAESRSSSVAVQVLGRPTR